MSEPEVNVESALAAVVEVIGGSTRDGQIEMAKAVDQAFKTKKLAELYASSRNFEFQTLCMLDEEDFEINGILIDAMSMQYMNNATVDFKEDLMGCFLDSVYSDNPCSSGIANKIAATAPNDNQNPGV